MIKIKCLFIFLLFAFIAQSHSVFSKDFLNKDLSEVDFCKTKVWKKVYLASYPRSGSHWVRGLIECASGIATGSVYCDREPQHMEKIFPWGGYCCDHGYEGECRYPIKSDLVLIKTHFPSQPAKITQFDRCPYKLTIRIIRHPVDSFYSRYLRKPLGEIQDIVPSERIPEFIETWVKFEKYWNNKPNVVTFRYEDILADPAGELRKMLLLLNYEFSEEDIDRAIKKYPPYGTMLKSINHFSKKDLKFISTKLKVLMNQFSYAIPES